MTLLLECEGFEKCIVKIHEIFGGVQYIFRFDNNYGASVIKHGGSYGRELDLWELAVIKFNNSDNEDWNLNYDTAITDDVIGSLTDDEVRDLLQQIKEL